VGFNHGIRLKLRGDNTKKTFQHLKFFLTIALRLAMIMKQICQHFFITGRVQGVSFRYYTQQKAIELGVKGWVRNIADGRVEVMACADESTLNRFHDWLKHGPPTAEVQHLAVESVPAASFDDFAISRSV
jgi:acylphosphatase